MQPVQLSLLPDPNPKPPTTLVEQLPQTALATAITLLAGVIAKASVAASSEVTGGE